MGTQEQKSTQNQEEESRLENYSSFLSSVTQRKPKKRVAIEPLFCAYCKTLNPDPSEFMQNTKKRKWVCCKCKKDQQDPAAHLDTTANNALIFSDSLILDIDMDIDTAEEDDGQDVKDLENISDSAILSQLRESTTECTEDLITPIVNSQEHIKTFQEEIDEFACLYTIAVTQSEQANETPCSPCHDISAQVESQQQEIADLKQIITAKDTEISKLDKENSSLLKKLETLEKKYQKTNKNLNQTWCL
jgi:uncharacterized coiled-coil protein SlyX